MFLSINVRLVNGNAPLAEMVRVMVVRDKQPNGVIATDAEIFQDASVGGILQSLYNVVHLDRFLVLFDRTYAFSRLGNGNSNINKYIRIRIPLRGLRIQYNFNNFDNITDFVTNALLFKVITSAPTATDMILAFDSRFTFKDS